ncbi:MAG: DUF2726 domain-containing protein [Candidatus Woesearchaeota archaeon]
MYSFLLATETSNSLLLFSGLLLALMIAIPAGIFLKKKIEGGKEEKAKNTGNISVTMKYPYMAPSSFKFYTQLRKSIPDEYIIFPKVGLDNIMDPLGTPIVYNDIKNTYVDFCVFKAESLKPVAVIDVVDPEVSTIPVTKQSEIVTKALSKLDLPSIVFYINNEYTNKEILKEFLRNLDPLELETLRRTRAEEA